jgi:CDP-glycerol glycerophosphotransferase
MIDARFVQDAEGANLELSGSGARPASVSLVGTQVTVAARLTGRGVTWRAVVPLRAARWGGRPLPLPSGEYELRIDLGDAASDPPPPPALPLTQLGSLRAALAEGTLVVGPPIDPAYDAGEGRQALQRRYAARRDELENAVFFESGGGRRAGGDPLAIDREIARRHPEVLRYWSVADRSVAVPEGARAVVDGSPEWWRARGASRLLVLDDWLRRWFVRRPGQHVLQTWHGTPIEQVGLRRPGTDWRRWVAVVGESRRWNALLAQSPYAARVLRSAHALSRRPIWVEGSPRNDALVEAGGADARRMLGIGPAEKVLLYAPARRRPDASAASSVDPARLAAALGVVVLARRPETVSVPAQGAAGTPEGKRGRVIDVGGFPDPTQLIRAADLLVTDYSPVMFDFSVTGRPMFFLVPDLEHRRGTMGGFSFDLIASAPGPVVRTEAALVRAVGDSDPAAFSAAYARWRATFNSRDDGHAAERVVTRLYDEGFLIES